MSQSVVATYVTLRKRLIDGSCERYVYTVSAFYVHLIYFEVHDDSKYSNFFSAFMLDKTIDFGDLFNIIHTPFIINVCDRLYCTEKEKKNSLNPAFTLFFSPSGNMLCDTAVPLL